MHMLMGVFPPCIF